MKNNRKEGQQDELRWLAVRTATVVGVVIAMTAMALTLFVAGEFFLLIFAGILLAVFLHGLARIARRYMHTSYGLALAAVILLALGIAAGAGLLLAPIAADQVEQLQKQLPGALERLRQQVQGVDWIRSALEQLPPPERLATGSGDLISRVTGFFSGTLSLLANTLVILFVALYTAASPESYRRGILSMVPPARHERADELLGMVAETLWRWLIGKLASMTIVGIFTWVGLWLLGIPLAGVLALVAALFAFIPNIGPVLSAIPAVLVAFSIGPTDALFVVILYIGIQLIESYLITPFIQKKAVSLPPALIISAQVLLGILAGGLGLMLATPLVAATLVIVRELYVKDLLGNR